MDLQEIVGAVINSVLITTDEERIDASRVLKQEVQLISRSDARRRAISDLSGRWLEIARGRTLFLMSPDGGIFRPRLAF
jgi:hypothetical protein